MQELERNSTIDGGNLTLPPTSNNPFIPASDQPLGTDPRYPTRSLVPHATRGWHQEMPDYNPPFFESPRLAEMDRTTTPGGWADPSDVSKDDFELWKKTGYMKSYEGDIQLDEETGRPLCPLGRTGIAGRGVLGKWGANHASDAIVTRISPHTKKLEVLLIQRACGTWAIPGGMVDNNETPLEAAYRELQEETSIELTKAISPVVVYQGIGDGPRTTDNAWIETTAHHFHLDESNNDRFCEPTAGDDAKDAKWEPVSSVLVQSLYANHGQLLSTALAQFRARNTQPLSESVEDVISSMPHVPLVTNFASLSGRIGILGGSFDPVHNGHVEVAKRAMAQHNLDAVVCMPTPQNPLKGATPGATGRERCDMLYYALKDAPGIFVSPDEVRRNTATYTADTLARLRAQLDDSSELFFILGADCLEHFHEWIRYDQILELATLIPITRDTGNTSSTTEHPFLTTLSEHLAPEYVTALKERIVSFDDASSSTKVREAMQRGDSDISVAPEVLRYSRERGLYEY
jgi:ADP-ribose pyrophosphatase